MRPESFSRDPNPAEAESLSSCPFCAGKEGLTPPEVFALRPAGSQADGPGWEVRVVPNKYPAFRETPDSIEAEALYRSMAAEGRHEVIIHGPEHNATMANMPSTHISKVFSVYRDRLESLSKDPKLASAIIIINQGREAGASIEHPHSQLFALPIVAPSIATEMARTRQARENGENCPVCSMLEHEARYKKRVIAENEDFLAFCPFASRMPFEVYIVPKAHQPSFAAVTSRDLEQAASIVKSIMERLRDRLGDPPYNIYLHTSPFNEDGDYHWHLTLLPKLSTPAGFELGTSIMINIVDPDTAAEFLR